jgi:hypothetical protein
MGEGRVGASDPKVRQIAGKVLSDGASLDKEHRCPFWCIELVSRPFVNLLVLYCSTWGGRRASQVTFRLSGIFCSFIKVESVAH